MKIAIIGAGLTGLTVANELNEYAKVVVFEQRDIGGLVSSICNNYCIEKFYHHCFKFDRELIELIKRFGLLSKLKWKIAKTGFLVRGKIYPLNTPIEILRYPFLSLKDKLKLAIFTIKSRRRNYEEYDDITAVDGIKSELGESLLKNFFIPLLSGKFGENYKDVSYAWLLARVAIRSNRKLTGEEIGYLRHGFHQLIEKMCEDVEIRRERAKISRSKSWQVNGERYDAVVYTGNLAEFELYKFPIRYQSSICVLLASESSLTENLYWINVVDDLSFKAIIEHTNFMPFEDYGENLIYLASYTTPESELFKLSNDEIAKIFISDLEKLGLKRDDIKWIRVFKAKYSGPIYERGYLSKITPYRFADGLYIAGMTSKPNYPERSMNGSVKAGMEVAEVVKRDFSLPSR